jgi:hypothetical protein
MYKIILVFSLGILALAYFVAPISQGQTSTQQDHTTEPQRDRDANTQGQGSYRQAPNYTVSPGDQGLLPGSPEPNSGDDSPIEASKSSPGAWVWAVVALVALLAILIPWSRRRRSATPGGMRGGPPL